MDEKGKKRGANFSSIKINLLMNCLLPEIKIIENKQTDGASLKEKQDAWRRVHSLFTVQNKDQLRDLVSLKLKYENIKRNLKKKISENKLELKKTGGGPLNEKKLVWYEEQLYEILQVSIEGLQSQGDCDDPVSQELYNSLEHRPGLDVNVESICSQMSGAAHATCDFENMEEDEVNREFIPQEKIVIENLDTKSITPKFRWTLKKRKTVGSEEKKSSLHAFDRLSEKKTDLTLTQKKCFEKELDIKIGEESRLKEEWTIKKQILEMELKYKEEQLSQIKHERRRQEAMFILNEKEKKLKIEILQCQLDQKIRNIES